MFGSEGCDVGSDLAFEGNGTVGTGYFSLDVPVQTRSLSASAGQDIFRVGFDALGVATRADDAPGPADDQGYGIAVDPFGDLIVAGTTGGTAPVTPAECRNRATGGDVWSWRSP